MGHFLQTSHLTIAELLQQNCLIKVHDYDYAIFITDGEPHCDDNTV